MCVRVQTLGKLGMQFFPVRKKENWGANIDRVTRIVLANQQNILTLILVDPVVLMFTLAFICALQIVLDLRDHPLHRILRLW